MRIFYNNTEISKDIDRLDESFFSMSYTTGNYLYMASDFPFNNLFIKLGDNKNLVAANMKVEYWGSKWNEVVELRDGTNGLFNDGYIEFTPDKNATWNLEDDSDEIGLTKIVYNKYWVRVSFNVNLTASISLSFIGHKFSDDSDLFTEYPIFSNTDFMTAFKLGKNSWEEQHVKAAEMITMDLMKKSVILGPEQILERRKFIGASVCKTAEIIFTAFGNDYLEQKNAAREAYYQRLDLSQYAIDSRGDGILSPDELRTRQGWLSR